PQRDEFLRLITEIYSGDENTRLPSSPYNGRRRFHGGCSSFQESLAVHMPSNRLIALALAGTPLRIRYCLASCRSSGEGE
ncbi:TPA: hypothetical protein ACQT3A_005675, partial [Pseudomonas aeruginosa]